jgi:hypothetical protein
MGLLDQLKQQADALRTQTSLKQSMREDNVRVVDEAMHRTFHYLLELFKQLPVIAPTNPVNYQIPGVGDMKNLRYIESHVDSRKKKLGDSEVYDYIPFWIRWGSSESLNAERDMPAAISKLRDLLFAANVKFTEEEKRNEQRSLQKVVFRIPVAVQVDFDCKADYDNRRLAFYGKNSIRLGMDDYAVPADDVSEALLDELAKMLLGQPSELPKKYRTVLPRNVKPAASPTAR